ncbi:MAG: hypothetical protein M1548_06785, partial [Actinobacteria bacterium]|nr:hypothetical protein [Actinomycetota bacterium]
MSLSIKAKLTVYNSVIIGALFVAVALAIYYSMNSLLVSYLRDTLEGSADSVAQALSTGTKPTDRALLRRANGVTIRIKDEGGKILLTTDSEKAGGEEVGHGGNQVGSDEKTGNKAAYLIAKKTVRSSD